MDFKRYRLFVTLAEELHFGRAAQRAGVAQSVLSVQIKRLEDELGVALFERNTRSARLTHAGQSFVDEARAVLDRVDESIRVARAFAAGKARILRVGLTTVAALSPAPRILGDFRARHPEIELQIREIGTVDQESALALREIDAGFLHPPLDQPGTAILARAPSRFVGLRRVAPGAPTRLRETWSEALAQPLIFYGRRRAPRLYDALISAAQAQGVSPVIAAEARSFLSAVAAAAAGIGLALAPEEMIAAAPDNCAVIDLPDCPLRLQNGVASRADDADPALAALLAHLDRPASPPDPLG